MSALLLASAGMISLSLGAFPSEAWASPTPTPPFTECPAVGYNTSCTLLINLTNSGATILQDPAATIASDPTPGTYDGVDDTLIGVVNNSSVPVSSLPLSSSTQPIMAFDGDGICANPNPTSGLPGLTGSDCNTTDTSGYGGPDSYFTGISADDMSGTVNFITPLAPGQSTFFSLEEALNSTSFVVPGTITLTPPTATPNVGTNDTVTATVLDSTGTPISGTTVTFDITAGPNSGKTATGTTNASGVATFTYSSVLPAGLRQS